MQSANGVEICIQQQAIAKIGPRFFRSSIWFSFDSSQPVGGALYIYRKSDRHNSLYRSIAVSMIIWSNRLRHTIIRQLGHCVFFSGNNFVNKTSRGFLSYSIEWCASYLQWWEACCPIGERWLRWWAPNGASDDIAPGIPSTPRLASPWWRPPTIRSPW